MARLRSDLTAAIIGLADRMLSDTTSEEVMNENDVWINNIGAWANTRFPEGVDASNATVLLEVEKHMVEKYPQHYKPGLLSAALFADSGQPDKALPFIAETLLARAEAALKLQQNRLRFHALSILRRDCRRNSLSYINLYRDAIYPQRLDALLKLVEAQETTRPAAFLVERALISLDTAPDRGTRLVRYLEEKARRYPDNEQVLARCVQAMSNAADVKEEMQALDRLTSIGHNPGYRWRLFNLWQQLDNPQQAQAAAFGGLADVVNGNEATRREAMYRAAAWMCSVRSMPTARRKRMHSCARWSADDGSFASDANLSMRVLWQKMGTAVRDESEAPRPE